MNPIRLFIATLALCLLAGAAREAAAQLPASEHSGATALGLELRRLGTTKRVLMIGAHPDDESTQILSTLALGQGAEVAYLSLTRGEGGQNGIGPELQEGLGLLRSEELLSARRLDGARQFFTRAYDFGFSRNAEETFRQWPRDSVLADVVATIRAFRPDVVIAVFSGTPADGHGQHQVSGMLAREGFAAAGDPSRFPEQIAAGLRPFAPAKLFQGVWQRDAATGTRLNTGEFDPLLGRSYFQVAMASRSRHRSQDMGRIQTPGPQASLFRLAQSNVAGGEAGLFSGIDTTLSARLGEARRAGTNGGSGRAASLLADYEQRVARIAGEFNPLRPERSVDALAAALRTLARADSALGASAPELRFRLAEERDDAQAALWRAQGLVLDAVASDETVVPGQPFELVVSLWNGGTRPVSVRSLEPVLPAGWSAEAMDPLPEQVAPGALATRRFRVRVPRDAPPTQPYFLRQPRTGDLYRWPMGVRVGVPFEPAPVRAAARVMVADVALREERDASFRDLDKMQGEVRRPVRVVPAVSVLVDPTLAVVPVGAGAVREPRRFAVRLRAEAPDTLSGSLRLRAPAGWKVEPQLLPLRFAPGDERVVEVVLTPPPGLSPGEAVLRAAFEAEGGARFDRGYTRIDYPHTRPHALYRPAEARLRALEVRVPARMRVGYIAGAGDDAPEALRQMGVQVETVSPAQLAAGDLGRFDAVVTGIRAYEVRSDLLQHNQRLLEYARDGGTVVVQYNKYEFTKSGIAPYPVEMSRPHDRVTDETAAVRLLHPEHPALSWPNRITERDFDGWVQERGLYHLRKWDPRFTPLLEMADPGQAPQQGSLVVAPVGKGHYVYTGLALFRQLPEGVPGAYRLLANLISLGAKR